MELRRKFWHREETHDATGSKLGNSNYVICNGIFNQLLPNTDVAVAANGFECQVQAFGSNLLVSTE